MKILLIIVLLSMLYSLSRPVPIEPESWNAPSAPGYTDQHAVNQRLGQLNQIDLQGYEGRNTLLSRQPVNCIQPLWMEVYFV